MIRTAPPPHRIIGNAEARFWSKVSVPFQPGTCWTWVAGLNHDGYGSWGPGTPGESTLAHRWLYDRLIGVPEGKELDHLCRNRACVRPDHLEPVDHRTNVLRGEGLAAKIMRRPTCPQGHPYDSLDSGKYRRCSTCRKANRRAA